MGLFLAYQNGYIEKENFERKILTDEMIKEYENDLKNGVDVSSKEYVIVKPSYANIYTNNLLKVSKKIENSIDKVIKYFFKKVSEQIND